MKLFFFNIINRIVLLILLVIMGPYESISQNKLQQMVDNTPDGGIVIIPEGEYVINEPLLINSREGLTLRGQGECKILLTDVWREVLEVSKSNSIRIEGLYFSHLKPLKEYQCNGAVIVLNNTKKVLIDNCEMEGSGTIGVKGNIIDGLTISHCFIHDNTFNAFYFSNASRVLIHNCVIENNANLIQSYKLDDFEMSDNFIRNNGGYWREKGKNPGLLNVGIDQKNTSDMDLSNPDNKSTFSSFELLQGMWQHVEDKSNYLFFEKNYRREIAAGKKKWDSETFIISNKCENEFDENNRVELENGRYISCFESDLCWYIIELDKDNLSLSYMGRGNTLTYKRVKKQ